MRIRPAVRDLVKERQRDGETLSGCIRRVFERDERHRDIETMIADGLETAPEDRESDQENDEQPTVTVAEGQVNDLVATISHKTAQEVETRLSAGSEW